MKKNIIALAIASAVAAPVAMADAPTVYGQLNMAVEQVNNSDEARGTVATGVGTTDDNMLNDGTQVNSRASRLGVKGSEDLGNGMKAVYKIEFGVGAADNSDLSNRNQYVGLAGDFGTVLMGRHDTPTKMIQAKDLFNDSFLADNRRFGGELGAFGRSGEVRANNVLAYVSPSFGGVKLIGAFVPKEDSGDATEASSLSDLMSFALTYGSKKKGLYLAGSMDMGTDSYTGESAYVDDDGLNGETAGDTFAGEGEDVQHMRLVAQYAAGGLIANAMYQDFGGDGLDDGPQGGTNIQANLGYKMGNIMPKLKVSSVDRDNNADGTKNEDSTNYAVGLNYSFGKKTTGYAEYASIENWNGTKDADTTAVSVGLLHKF